MALRNQPYIPLYVQDFLTDEKLIECSPEATGVYIRLLCILHKSDEYGKILLKQKDKQTPKHTKNFAYKLLKQMPWGVEIIEKALDELLDEGVIQIENDYLMQKRMVRDNEISIKRSISGKRGGEKTQFALAKHQAKGKANIQANSENEYEYENEVKNEVKKDLKGFSDFWSIYPKKKSKGGAEKAWKQMVVNKKIVDAILKKIPLLKQTDDWQKENGQFIPYPATWLRAKGWEDEEPEVYKKPYLPPEPPTFYEHEAPDPEKYKKVDSIIESLSKSMEVNS